MKNIEKLINECIKMEQSIVNDVFKVDVFKCKKELEYYKQAQNLQLQQTGVKQSVCYCKKTAKEEIAINIKALTNPDWKE